MQFLDNEGKINYNAIKKNEEWLNEHLNRIKITDTTNFNSRIEEFVFYLNCYNLLSLKSVLIELEKNPNWNGNISKLKRLKFFVLRKFQIGGKKISLYELENKILRKKFKDPRMHFAINCASASCPVLPGKMFFVETLEEYLELLTKNFINESEHVVFDPNRKIVKLNPIFKWYKEDFEPEGILKFIANYKEIVPDDIESYSIKFLNYDWSLNKQ